MKSILLILNFESVGSARVVEHQRGFQGVFVLVWRLSAAIGFPGAPAGASRFSLPHDSIKIHHK